MACWSEEGGREGGREDSEACLLTTSHRLTGQEGRLLQWQSLEVSVDEDAGLGSVGRGKRLLLGLDVDVG